MKFSALCPRLYAKYNKMLNYFVLLTLFCLSHAASIQKPVVSARSETTPNEVVAILKSVAEKKSDGSYIYAFEGSDGSFREEVGILKNPGTIDEYLEVSGTYRYIDANGEKIEVHYTADENGFVPEGTNIPKEISDAAKLGVEAAKLEAAAYRKA